ncbi:nuclear transport factor 2 family protein [uncultured Microscilla sp.]|uniref:YybH family protein n=1 Tax=uncultured Microscilla sp. TaxID=432653 RepID=UPI00262ABDB2|nr:nuclear transport factor 2 family protein [uncultured Microscilla sp.]
MRRHHFLWGVCGLLFALSTPVLAQTAAQDKQAIIAQARAFSKAFVAKDTEKIVRFYTTDASIFPNRTKILQGHEAIRKYWSFNAQVAHLEHKLMPEKIEIVGNTAYDYGYYKGTTQRQGKPASSWQGKYVVVWKKVQGVWKMHLDIWNSVKQ